MSFIPPLVSSSWKEVLCLRTMLVKTPAGSHCKGRYCSCSRIPAPWCLSYLTRSCKCLRFLPGPFWYLVVDPWCMRGQALKLLTVVWSTKCIARLQVLVRKNYGCWRFLSLFSYHCPVLPVWDFDMHLLLCTTPVILPFLPFSFPLSQGRLNICFPLTKN